MTQPRNEAAVAHVRSFVAALSPPAGEMLSRADMIAAAENHVQVETIARAIVAPSWKAATPAQCTRLCTALLYPMALTLAEHLRHSPKVSFRPQRSVHGTTRWEITAALLFSAGPSIEVSWRGVHNRDGPRIYDISIERISFAESMRSQFFATRGDIDAVSAQLEAAFG